jgi:AraC family transcriptional regulator, regulatory protein of adaptative response / DNA-3-methyladenine glycosylase II
MGENPAPGPGQAPGPGRGAGHEPGPDGRGLTLRLAHRSPYAHGQVFGFLGRRAVPGVEEMTGEPGGRTYRRTLRLPYGTGIAEVDEASRGPWLDCRLHLTDLRDLTTAVQRVRRLFDLDADPEAVAERLGDDGAFRPLVEAAPGLRSPGAADPHELAVRAVLGQQITVAAARTLAGRLVAAYGKPLASPDGGLTHLFPDADTLASAPLGELGMPERRRATLRGVAEAAADGTVVLDPGADRDEAERSLLALRGVGPWTAGYVRMRALGDPDVFLDGDVGVRHGLARVGAGTSGKGSGKGGTGSAGGAGAAWRPWRSYALHHLWHLASA